ncbi:MAG TPA: DNA alkylation repair protein [Candidatus Saccharimonadales bacterium]
MTAADVKQALKDVSDAEKAKNSAWFFKSGPGEYGEGDKFIGVTVPNQRKVANKFKDLALDEIIKLISSPIHEHRLSGVIILVGQFDRSKTEATKQEIYDTYFKLLDAGHINNWDIVDSSAHQIVGGWLADKNRGVLVDLARSGQLWHQRVAIIATYHFIKQEDFTDTILVAELLLDHPHDLIHKAVGWMLREIGNRDRGVVEEFLQKHYKYMPRTMLRYAIEKFPEELRRLYLEGTA